VVAFGGGAPASGPPSGIAVGSPHQIGMTVKATGDPNYPAPDLKSNSSCASDAGGGASVQGHVTPDTGTSAGNGFGNINGCWLVLASGTLTVNGSFWINFAIDAGWGQVFGSDTSHVTFQGSPRGPVKSATLDGSNVPTFDRNVGATAGVGPTTGGISVNGITAPTVEGQVFGPDAPNQQATVLHGGFGAVGYASADGGTTVKVASETGGWAVDWFTGTSGTWLVFGAPGGNPAHTLTAFHDWTPATPTASSPNLAGAQTTDNSLLLGGSALTSSEIFATALQGATGTDMVFVGLSDSNGFDGNADGAVRRLTLSSSAPDPHVTDVGKIGDGQITKAIHAMAYCPATGSADSIKGVLLVATGTTTAGGGLWRVTDATGDAPVATQVASIPSADMVFKVRAHCASGTVWAGTSDGAASLYKSTDGGQTFTTVAISRPGQVQAIGINPADANELLIGVNREGTILRTTDGGTTWMVENDPGFDHNFSGDGIADLLIPPATTATRALRSGARFSPRAFSGLTNKDVLVAGAGVYSAPLRSTAAPPAPGGSGCTPTCPGGAAADKTAPVITGFKVTNARFRVSSKPTATSAKATKRAPKGTTFKLTLSETATVRLAIARLVKGYRSGKRCVAKKPRKGKIRRCTRAVAKGALIRRNRAKGPVKIPFTGRIGTRALKPGRYRTTATATDAAKNRSKAHKLTFRVVRK